MVTYPINVGDWYRKFGLHREFRPSEPNSIGVNALTSTIIAMGMESREIPLIQLYNPLLAEDGPAPDVIKELRYEPPSSGDENEEERLEGDAAQGEHTLQGLDEGENQDDKLEENHSKHFYNEAQTKLWCSKVFSFLTEPGSSTSSGLPMTSSDQRNSHTKRTPPNPGSRNVEESRRLDIPSLEPWILRVSSFTATEKRLNMRYPHTIDGRPGAVVNMTAISPRGGKWIVSVGARMSLFVFRMRDTAV